MVPVTVNLLRPHLEDMQRKIEPGMLTLTLNPDPDPNPNPNPNSSPTPSQACSPSRGPR